MSADRLIDLTRGYRRAVESYGREALLNEAGMPLSAGTDGARSVILDDFATGYDGSETTLPFTADVSIVGGDDIVTG